MRANINEPQPLALRHPKLLSIEAFKGSVLNEDYISALAQDYAAHETKDDLHSLMNQVYVANKDELSGLTIDDEHDIPLRLNPYREFKLPSIGRNWFGVVLGEVQPARFTKPASYPVYRAGQYALRESVVLSEHTYEGRDVFQARVLAQLIPVKTLFETETYSVDRSATNARVAEAIESLECAQLGVELKSLTTRSK